MKRFLKCVYFCLLSCLMVAAAVLAACGQTTEKLEAKLTPEFATAYAILGEEFDFEPYIVKQEGVTYAVKAEYFDETEMVYKEIPCNGFKFTPTENTNVFITLTATKGDETDVSEQNELFVQVNVDPVEKYILNRWNDEGIAKSVNTDKQYIKGDKSNTSMKISFFGKESNLAGRWQAIFGLSGEEEITKLYSLKNWEDAVLEFWVYNPNEQAIEVAPRWAHNGAGADYGVTGDEESDLARICAPKAWTHVKYSLRYYGITENWFYDRDVYASYIDKPVEFGIGYTEDGKPKINMNFWYSRYAGRPSETGVVFGYDFYIDNYDIRDYNANDDADLDHELFGIKKVPIRVGEGDLSLADFMPDAYKSVSFEYTIENDEALGIAFLDNWTEFYGYFYFTKDGKAALKNGEDWPHGGVTVEPAGENGWYKATIDFAAVNYYNNGTKQIPPAYIGRIYSNKNNSAAVGYVKNFEFVKGTAYKITVENGTGAGTYLEGKQITVVADEIVGKKFVRWVNGAGAEVSTLSTYTFTPDSNLKLVAEYEDAKVSYSVTSTENGEAVVTEVSYNSEVTATATAAQGRKFAYWINENGDVISALNPYKFTITQNTALVAVFVDESVELKFKLTVKGGSADKEIYDIAETATVTLDETAVPAKTVFAGWKDEKGNIVSTDKQYKFAVSREITLEAAYKWTENTTVIENGTILDNFEKDVYGEASFDYKVVTDAGYLRICLIGKNDAGGWEADGNVRYGYFVFHKNGVAENSPAGITVTPVEKMDGWYHVNIKFYEVTEKLGEPSNIGLIYSFGTNGTIEVANLEFVKSEKHTVIVENGTGGGSFLKNSKVTVTAAEIEGKNFIRWVNGAGEQVSTDASYVLTVVSDITLKAEYEDITFTYSVTSTENGEAVVTTQVYGTQLTATAIVPEGKKFAYWVNENGDVISSDNPYAFAIKANVTLVARFINEGEVVTFTVTVVGGTADKAEYGANETATVTLDESKVPSKAQFAGWANENGSVVSSETEYKFAVTANVSLKATYVWIETPDDFSSASDYTKNIEAVAYSEISFDYKITSDDGYLRIAFLQSDWGSFYGYFVLFKDGTVESTPAGVTVSAIEGMDGWYHVTVKLAEVTVKNGEPTNVGVIYGRGSTATGKLVNFEYKKAE